MKEESKHQDEVHNTGYTQDVFLLDSNYEAGSADLIAIREELESLKEQEIEEISNKISALIAEGEDHVSRKYQSVTSRIIFCNNNVCITISWYSIKNITK